MGEPNHQAKAELYRLVVLGDGGVGKTALTIQLCLNHFVEVFAYSYRKQVYIDGEASMLEVLDTAGQEEYTALRDQWIRDGEGFLLVYSIASRVSFERLRSYRDHILRVKDWSSAPIILVGNKADKFLEREVTANEAAALAKTLGVLHIETSAKTSTNVEEAFFNVVRKVRQQRQPPSSSKGTSSAKKRNKKSSKCVIA